jgi:hypothetical protein
VSESGPVAFHGCSETGLGCAYASYEAFCAMQMTLSRAAVREYVSRSELDAHRKPSVLLPACCSSHQSRTWRNLMRTTIYPVLVSLLVIAIAAQGCMSHTDTEDPDDTSTSEATQASGAQTSAGGLGSPCTLDVECMSGVCNTFQHQCAFRAGIGTSCNRDFECMSGVCNSFQHRCAFQAGIGTSCNRDFECMSGICNTFQHQCAFRGGLGTSCNRGFECASGVCNSVTHRCS